MIIQFETVEGKKITATSPTIKLIEDPEGTTEPCGPCKYGVVIGENREYWGVTATEFSKLKKKFEGFKNGY